MAIEHPLLTDLGINAVVVEEVTQPTRVDDSGIWLITISFIEYRRPRPQLETASGVVSEGSVDQQDHTIAALAATVDSLAGEEAVQERAPR